MVEEDEEGVLLYYKFASIPEPQSLALWFQSNCSSLELVGRVRVAPGGVNVTIGGPLTSLHEHINAVYSHPWLGECDFKLAPVHNLKIKKSTIAPEVGFGSLGVSIVKELVTLGLHPSKSPSISDAGTHLSAVEFHYKILQGELMCRSDICNAICKAVLDECFKMSEAMLAHSDGGGNPSKVCLNKLPKLEENNEVVILDVRNIYETRIGRFVPPPVVQLLEPGIRQYSDLPHWIESHAERLRNKTVLMYCTGGVRCEMASAYLKQKGEGFQNVYQLSGGIQRYLEAFPDGGFFKGKNFVFDHRLAVSSSCPEVLGTCLCCGIAFDDYSSRMRCSNCRMLVLVCNICQVHVSSSVQPLLVMCELCRIHKFPNEDNSHRLLGLTSSEHDTVEEGPPERSIRNPECAIVETNSACCSRSDAMRNYTSTKRKLKILCLHGFRQSASSLKGRLAAFTKKLKAIAEFVFVDAPHEVPLIFSSTKIENDQKIPSPGVPKTKFAWLITPVMASTPEIPPAERIVDGVCLDRNYTTFDSDQYKRQTEGWPATMNKLEEIFSKSEHFDGILGFSQGAAVAAALCLVMESPHSNSCIKFDFVILCSGFISTAREVQNLMSSVPLPLKCPSLHIFADNAGHDRQIVNNDSQELESLFEADKSVVLTHSLGHIVPSQKDKIEKVKAFLNQFI